jgi:hypothetical protein
MAHRVEDEVRELAPAHRRQRTHAGVCFVLAAPHRPEIERADHADDDGDQQGGQDRTHGGHAVTGRGKGRR